jgi:hypothetical protein
VGGLGLDFETWVFRLGLICEEHLGLKIETWATHLIALVVEDLLGC